MKIMQIPDITKLTWQLNVAIMGVIFSVFALIYNVAYIYYGFITFLYGVVTHLVDVLFRFIPDDKNWKYPVFFILQFILIAVWLGILFLVY